MTNKGAGKGFYLISKNTNEYGREGVLMKVLKAYVLSKITKNSLLDIGSGQGNLAIPLSKLFNDTFIVEPYRKFFDATIKLGSGRINGLIKKWEEANLENRQFNLILAIHIFYYIPKKYWLKQLKRMIDILDRNGRIVVVLQSKESRLYTLPNKFLKHESRINSEELMQVLHDAGIKFTSHKLKTEIWANNKKGAEIVGNFLLDTHNAPMDNKRAIDMWDYKRGNKFFVPNRQHLILIDR